MICHLHQPSISYYVWNSISPSLWKLSCLYSQWPIPCCTMLTFSVSFSRFPMSKKYSTLQQYEPHNTKIFPQVYFYSQVGWDSQCTPNQVVSCCYKWFKLIPSPRVIFMLARPYASMLLAVMSSGPLGIQNLGIKFGSYTFVPPKPSYLLGS